VALMGRRIGYSLSPLMQNTAFKALGLPYQYFPLSLEEGDLPAVMEAFREMDLAGANVTDPYTEAVVSHLDELTVEAEACGNVNTIFRDGSLLVGDSTDGIGFLCSCRLHGVCLEGSRVLLIGAGGAARAVAFAVASAGAAGLVVVNRTRSRGEDLINALREKYPELAAEAVVSEELGSRTASACLLVVNTTPLGMGEGDDLPLPAEFITPDHIVCDLSYSPARTGLMAAADKAGAVSFNGLAMLLFQGAASFGRWTGREAPLKVMADALCLAAAVESWPEGALRGAL
jgi:shikimate dehydrogenase